MDAASVTSSAPPRPSRMPASLALATTGFCCWSGSSHTARRQSRIWATQLTPVNSSTAPAMTPTVPALSTSEVMSSRLDRTPGNCWAILCSTVFCRSGPSVAALTAAARVSSGNREMKLTNVMAAASRVHFTRSSRS